MRFNSEQGLDEKKICIEYFWTLCLQSPCHKHRVKSVPCTARPVSPESGDRYSRAASHCGTEDMMRISCPNNRLEIDNSGHKNTTVTRKFQVNSMMKVSQGFCYGSVQVMGSAKGRGDVYQAGKRI